MTEYTTGKYKDRKYFSSIRNYTLSLLDTFNGINYWVEQLDVDETQQKEFTLPISFGNYEKSAALKDIDESTLTSGNFNFLPRLVLSFEGMTKSTDRQTNKFQKLTKKIYDNNTSRPTLDVSYNSLAYDFHFTLLVQSRGYTITSQIVENILINFNPSLNLMIKEFPIFEDKTETQILISDPAFEVLDEFAEEEINLQQVTFDITVRGNIYSEIDIQGPIETVNMYTHIWDQADYEDSVLSRYYKFDVSESTGKIYKETERTFNGTLPYDDIVNSNEKTVIAERPDYHKYQNVQDFPDGEYNKAIYVPDPIIASPQGTNNVPTIRLIEPENNPLIIDQGQEGWEYWEDTAPGAEAFDIEDGDITDKIISTHNVDMTTVGDYIIYYLLTDSDGNSVLITRDVSVRAPASEAPVIVKNGDDLVIAQYACYRDLGATAIDAEDGDITENIITTDNVNNQVAGSYTIDYEVTDSTNITSSTSRIVDITPNPVNPLNWRYTCTLRARGIDSTNEAEVRQGIKDEFGPTARPGDWNELVAEFGTSADLDRIFNIANTDNQGGCTRNGGWFWSGSRAFFFDEYGSIENPSFTVHATIDNHYCDLGSWYGSREYFVVID